MRNIDVASLPWCDTCKSARLCRCDCAGFMTGYDVCGNCRGIGVYACPDCLPPNLGAFEMELIADQLEDAKPCAR